MIYVNTQWTFKGYAKSLINTKSNELLEAKLG